MKFKNEKEFEFNVYYDLRSVGLNLQILEKPFDSKMGNLFVEFKISKFEPSYHEPMIHFTKSQTTCMLVGNIPLVLVCGETDFYLLPTQKIEELINARGRINRPHVWISEKDFKDYAMSYTQMIENLKEIIYKGV